MQARGALNAYLDGSVAMADHMVRCGETLALGLNSGPHADAAETLQDPATIRTLERMHAALQPEIVIYDMSPMLAYDDVSAFLPQLDGVLLVSDGTQTTARQLTECERMLDGQVPLVGVVLNRARHSSVARYT
jgi:MinD-like ATPase involved in chromosome partitioning or flagellar assembly